MILPFSVRGSFKFGFADTVPSECSAAIPGCSPTFVRFHSLVGVCGSTSFRFISAHHYLLPRSTIAFRLHGMAAPVLRATDAAAGREPGRVNGNLDEIVVRPWKNDAAVAMNDDNYVKCGAYPHSLS